MCESKAKLTHVILALPKKAITEARRFGGLRGLVIRGWSALVHVERGFVCTFDG